MVATNKFFAQKGTKFDVNMGKNSEKVFAWEFFQTVKIPNIFFLKIDTFYYKNRICNSVSVLNILHEKEQILVS
jgi:hypothetical protein